MVIYYLMVKTHRITGLKYLCQTRSKNPHKYKGSGKYWKRHLKKHGEVYDTEIIQKCYTKTALREWGLYYSKLWSVVRSKKWANMMDEAGDGMEPDVMRKLRADVTTGYHKHNFIESMRHNQKTRMENEDYRKNISTKVSDSVRVLWKSQEYQEKNCERYLVSHTDGRSFEILNLNKFCRDNDLQVGNLWAVSVGKRPMHKGWTCRKI